MPRSNVTYIILFILALILLVGNTEQKNSKARFLSSTLFYPFINSVRIIEDVFNTKAENETLKENLSKTLILNNNLQNLLEKYRDLQTDYTQTEYGHILAGVVGYNGIFEERTLIIDKGSLDGVEVDFPVITASGIVGKIESVSLNYSIVLPYNHSKFKLGIMSSRNRLQGLLISDVFGDSFMSLIKLGSDVAIGDTIITSNFSSIFPPNFPVGRVSLIKEHSNQINMLAKVDGFIDPANLNYVIVLKYKREKAYETEINN
ncbi:rod shape-determining protein MreC [Candidatus Cloacimonadota bacterium]